MNHATDKPRILIVEDDAVTADLISHFALNQGFSTVVSATSQSAAAVDWDALSAVLLDLHLPDGDGFDLLVRARKRHPNLPCFVLTSRDSADTAVAALKAGAADYFTKPFEPSTVFSSIRESLSTPPAPSRPTPLPSREWKSPAMLAAHRAALDAAQTPGVVLLTGAPSTGRRAFAQFIHSRSRRAKHPFAAVDASSLDDLSLELELFGGESRHHTGSFVRKRGKIEMAHGGTLFIQDIDHLSAPLQSRLLDALEMRTEAGQIPWSDFRLIASTRVDLQTRLHENAFRRDLFYRLSTTSINLPCLREAVEDIPTWCDRILTEICVTNRRRRPKLTRGAIEMLVDHPWPGDLDQLRHTLEYAVAHSTSGLIGIDDLPPDILSRGLVVNSDPGSYLGWARIGDLERASLVAALEACDGNRRRVAKRLGVSLRTVYNMIDRHALRASRD